MSTASSLQQPAPDVSRPSTGQQPEETEGRSPHTETRSSGFRIGFFVRKIRDGEIVYEKRFPSYGRSTRAALAPDTETRVAIDGPGSHAQAAAPRMMMAAEQPGGGGSLDDDVTTQDGAGMGDDNPGPIGGTSYEVGAFAGTVTTA